MTILPMWKKCPKCHMKYDWNPDAGHFNCPYCLGLGKPGGGILENIFGKKKDFINGEDYGETEDLVTKN